MNCPYCGLINPNIAGRCNCGYDFQSQKVMKSYLSGNIPSTRMRERTRAVLAAFSIGWFVCALEMIITAYDGFIFLIFLPFTSAAISGIFVALALLVGLVLRIPIVSQLSNKTPIWAGLTAGLSFFVLAFGYSLGLTVIGMDPESGSEVVRLHPIAAIGGYLFLLFAVANWPTERKARAS